MANVKISALPPATTVAASDLLPVVQGGVTKQVTPDLLPLSAAAATALAGKAGLASPAFTGSPTIGGTTVAKTSDITAAITALVGSAPAALDTLQEIDAQLTTDEGSAAALAALVAGKAAALTAQATRTVSATLTADTVNPFDATTGPLTATLPTPSKTGQVITVEKVDTTANLVTIAGTLRGTVGSMTISTQYESIVLVAESLTSWRPVAGHRTKTALDTAIAGQITAQAATDAATYATNGSNAAILMNRLALGRENASLLILGDSTGVIGAAPWPLLVAQWLATQYPQYTVNYRVWSDPSQAWIALGGATSYPTGTWPQTASTVVQTGTGTGNAGGPFVLDIWNGSVSGSKADYPGNTLARWNALAVAAAPQLTLVNYGHNSNASTTGYRATHYPLLRYLEQQFPEAGIVQVAQNPRSSDTGSDTIANDLIRARTVMDLAATEGHGLVNITQRFLANPTFGTDWILNDSLYIHPNPAGSTVWAQETQKHLQQAATAVPRGPYRRPSQLWLPAQEFALASGTATLGQINSGAMAWSCPSGSHTDLVASFVPPDYWSQFDLVLRWSAATVAATFVTWGTGTRNEGIGITDVQSGSSVTTASAGFSNSLAPPYYVKKAPNSSNYATYGFLVAPQFNITNRPMGLRVSRFGEVAADDTYLSPAYFLGALLVRAR